MMGRVIPQAAILIPLLASSVAGLLIPSRVAGFRYPITWRLNSMAEKVLQNPTWPPEWPYSEEDFKRMDESDDSIFYDSPRLVSSIFGYMGQQVSSSSISRQDLTTYLNLMPSRFIILMILQYLRLPITTRKISKKERIYSIFAVLG
jgi:hypothetical protein